MSTRVRFGYNTPAGERGIERIEPATFGRDLEDVCDVAAQFMDAFWVPDHFMRGDTFRLECWTQLTWLAARYATQQLGTVVLCNSYRHPPLMAKMASSLQHFSRGRLVLGYGAGWLEDEYRAYGYPFPSTRERIAQMVEGIQAMRALWTRSPASFEGAHYHVREAYAQPRPEPIPPVMIGGDGERYLLRAVAEHADWWLSFSRDDDTLRRKLGVLDAHCRDVGRDPATIERVYPMTVYLAPTRGEAERRAGARLEGPEPAFAGEPAALVARIQALVELGFRHFALAFGGFPATDDLRLFADQVVPSFH
jgi:alkanesulfonate monooxygenase SsuD/methylene tetrahydromethanopterin reductase-like flavin-dependent oxidoreductase (luciferase family)